MALFFSSLGFETMFCIWSTLSKGMNISVPPYFFNFSSSRCNVVSWVHIASFSLSRYRLVFWGPCIPFFLKIRRAPRDLAMDAWPITKLIRVTLEQSRDLPPGTSGRLWARSVPWLQSKRYTRADLVSFPRCFKPALTESLTHSLFFFTLSFSLSSLSFLLLLFGSLIFFTFKPSLTCFIWTFALFFTSWKLHFALSPNPTHPTAPSHQPIQLLCVRLDYLFSQQYMSDSAPLALIQRPRY